MTAGLGGDAQRSIERQRKCSKRVEGRQKGGEQATVIKPSIDGPAAAELIVAPGSERSGVCGRDCFQISFCGMLAKLQLLVDRLNLIVNRRQNGVFAPEA